MEANESTVLKVDGMTCRSCARHVEAALLQVEGVSSVEVKLREGEVVVQHHVGASIAAMIAAIQDAGYRPRRAA